MASDTMANGSTSTADGMTNAERLMQQHAGDESHKATVEEVPDEEVLAHPPPSASAPANSEPMQASEPTMSEKAAGKQPAREQAQVPKKPALDTKSEELFPSLGAPKSQPAAAPTMWSKKPAAVGKAAGGMSNGVANGASAPSNKTSRNSTPASGMMAPTSSVPSQRIPGQMSLPGRYSESINLHPSSLTPRNQLKKPVADILRDINKRSKAHIEEKAGPNGTVRFEGTGPVEAVRIALKEAASQLCAKQTTAIPVPAAIRGRIVGKQGATIQAISKKTGAKIDVSKQEAAEILADDDLDSTVDVTISGDPFAVQMAKQDIERIVNEHTSSVNTRLKHIPAEYYPFLAGPNNSRLEAMQQGRDLRMQIPQYHTWSEQAPPQAPSNRQPVAFTPQGHLPISIGGDRQAVADARAELDRQVQQLQRQLTLEQLAIERGRHQFIVGDMGTSLHDFLNETGCAIIMPPDGDDSEMLTVVGPPDRIDDGMNRIMDLASSMASASADVAKQHANAPRGAQAHARDLTRYLQQRQAIQQLEQQHNARIVPDSSGSWQIYSRDGKNAMKARSDVMNLISGHPPSRFTPMSVDPFYHEHLRQHAASHVRDQYGVRVVVPDELDDSPLLLVFEDRVPSPDYQFPRTKPSQQDTQNFQEALQEAQRHIMGLMSGQQEIVSRDVDAPVKFHDKIRKHADRHHQSLPQGEIPVQLIYGGPRQQGPRRQAQPSVNLRGPQNTVDELMQSLLAFIEQEKQDEAERGFTMTFDFPQKFANVLIGRKGENINKLREEFDVDIQLNDGKCEIKGPEAKANACKKHILEMGKKLEDEATHVLNIPQTYHRDLIGPQGKQVNRLQDRYHVRVNFPRTAQADSDEAGEEGAARRPNQAPNEVVIRGPSRGANDCREELLNLFQYVKDNSHTATVSVAQNQLPSLIGTGGREMEAMRLETGAQIDVPGARDEPNPNGRAEIKLKGSKKAVDDAKKLLEQRAKVFDDTVSRTMEVDRKFHRNLIGPGGSKMREIITSAGGPENPRDQQRTLRIPKGDGDQTIRIEGQQSVVDRICAAIQAVVDEQANKVTDVAEVKTEKHRNLIGRGGETKRNLENQFNVAIDIPRQTETGPERERVKIIGRAEDVEKCKNHILEMTKDMEGETVQVPKRFHHTVADNGQFFKTLRRDHKVTVDHAGQRPPPRPTAPTPSRNAGGSNGAMPLITDDPSANSNNHSWESHDLHASAEDGEIPWVLAGPSQEALASARSKLERALAEAGKQDTVGFLILPDPRSYRFVIGPGGSEINRIRKASGTKIQVPRAESQGEAIEIVGSKEGVEKARDSILETVNRSGQ